MTSPRMEILAPWTPNKSLQIRGSQSLCSVLVTERHIHRPDMRHRNRHRSRVRFDQEIVQENLVSVSVHEVQL